MILIPVCLAYHDFLHLQTAFKNGKSAGIPRAEATTAKLLAVVFLTNSSLLSISGLIVVIIVFNPAALAKFEIISRPKKINICLCLKVKFQGIVILGISLCKTSMLRFSSVRRKKEKYYLQHERSSLCRSEAAQ